MFSHSLAQHLLGFVVCVFTCGATLSAYATTYYVSWQGKDTWRGTSSSQPWRTINRVNQQKLSPGDRVLFQATQTFAGSLYLAPEDTGTITTPVVIGSYGSGRAWISSGTRAGLFGYNVSGITVRNLNFIGAGSTVNTQSGVSFYAEVATGAEGLQISSVDVSGYGKNGIDIGTWNTASGYRHISVTSSVTHDNGNNGLLIYAQFPNLNQDVYVGGMTASYNTGSAGHTFPTGSGLVLGNVSGGTIEHSFAYENGRLCDSPAGPVGIWTYDSTKVVIQYNTSHHNHAIVGDGDGFDLDQNTSDSILQYNLSYENDGAGYLLAHGPNTWTHIGNRVQGNVSQNDSRKFSYGGILLWGRIRNATIQDNTVTLSPTPGGQLAATVVSNWSIPTACVENVLFTSNSFTISSGPALVEVTPSQVQCSSGLRFQGNTYQGNPFLIRWGASSYNSITAWHSVTGQE
jgi:hypothetical protein